MVSVLPISTMPYPDARFNLVKFRFVIRKSDGHDSFFILIEFCGIVAVMSGGELCLLKMK